MRRITIASIFALAAMILAGCVSSQPYWTQRGPAPDETGNVSGGDPAPQKFDQDPLIAIVEFDDFGAPFNRKQIIEAEALAKGAASNNGLVLVYVHGWHENARKRPLAHDLEEFKTLVGRVRANIGGVKEDVPVVGVYVAWRGEAVQTVDNYVVDLPSHLLTFVGRKAASQRVGSAGGPYELFYRLSKLRQEYPHSRLVLEGHSFGAGLLYSAFSSKLVEQIISDGEEKDRVHVTSDGAPYEPATVADMLVLLNPAFEAMRLRPQFEMARTLTYPTGTEALPPRLVIITTAADWATHYAFPAGRSISTADDGYSGRYGSQEQNRDFEQNITAVGHYIPYITHQLETVPYCDSPVLLTSKSIQEATNHTICVGGLLNPHSGYARVRLTRCDPPDADHPGPWCDQVAGEHFLRRNPEDAKCPPEEADPHPSDPQNKCSDVPYRLPIMNIRTTAAVSSGHTDIWADPLQNFILQLTLLAASNPGAIPTFRALP